MPIFHKVFFVQNKFKMRLFCDLAVFTHSHVEGQKDIKTEDVAVSVNIVPHYLPICQCWSLMPSAGLVLQDMEQTLLDCRQRTVNLCHLTCRGVTLKKLISQY